MYHSRIVLSVGGSVWYMIRNLRCTVTVDSVLANSKTQNALLFTVNAIFLHDYPLTVEPGSTPRPLIQKKNLGEILYLLICSFLPYLSWLLRSRVRKSRRDLWITLYMTEQLRYGKLTTFNSKTTSDPINVKRIFNFLSHFCVISWSATSQVRVSNVVSSFIVVNTGKERRMSYLVWAWVYVWVL